MLVESSYPLTFSSSSQIAEIPHKKYPSIKRPTIPPIIKIAMIINSTELISHLSHHRHPITGVFVDKLGANFGPA
jgi:hypothetical protein